MDCPAIVTRVMVVLVCVSALCLPLAAQETAPDRALLAQAQQAMATGQWATAATTLESFRTRFPTSPALADGLTLLYQAYLAQQLSDKAVPVGKEIVAKWPRSAAVWQVVLITAKQKAQTSAAEAVASLELALKGDMLAPADRRKAQHQRLLYLAQARSDLFLTEALDRVTTLTAPITPENAALTVDLAKILYPLLMTAGRFDDAKALSTKLQATLVTAGTPTGYLLAEQQAYLDALQAADGARYLAEARLAIKQVTLADTAEQVERPARLAIAVYPGLLKAQPYAEVKPLHELVQQALRQYALTALSKDESLAWLTAVGTTYPDQVVPEILAKITQLATANTADEVAFPVELMAKVYDATFTQQHPEVAQDVHDQLQAALQKFDLRESSITDKILYACRRLPFVRATAKPQYLTELTPTLTPLIEQCTTLALARPIWQLAYPRESLSLYADLFAAGKTQEAVTLAQQLRTVLRTFGDEALYEQWTHDYLYWRTFGAHDPAAFLPAYRERLASVARQCPFADYMALCGSSELAYKALLTAERVEEAQALHQQFLALATQQKTPDAYAREETTYYLNALLELAPRAFVAEVRPTLAQLAKAQTVEEALRFAPLVQMAYLGLNKSGCFQEARAAHDHLQALLTKFNRTQEAEADRTLYTANLSVQALEGMLQLFKQAIIAEDMVTAKQWLEELNGAAPESPQATRARKIWKETVK